MRLRLSARESADLLYDYLKRCGCIVRRVDDRVLEASGPPQSLNARLVGSSWEPISVLGTRSTQMTASRSWVAHRTLTPSGARTTLKDRPALSLTRRRSLQADGALSQFRQKATATHLEGELAGSRPTNAMAYKPY